MANELLLADGSVTESGPASFYNVAGDARGQAEFVSQAFMGVRLQCANCHDHPLDAWTQDDYHGLAAVFARIKRGAVISVDFTGMSLLVRYSTSFSLSSKVNDHALKVVVMSLADKPSLRRLLVY